jgi:hypothetical protein
VAAWLRTFHRATSVAIGLAVPLAIYLINGAIEPWAFVLGAVIGFLLLVFWSMAPDLSVRRKRG